MNARYFGIGTVFALLLTGCSGTPSVDLTVHNDPVAGWNLYVDAKNFSYTPEKLSTTADDNEGYAMLIVNGQVITRLYSEWTYLPGLPVGNNSISIALYRNNHTPVTVDDKEVVDTETVVAN